MVAPVPVSIRSFTRLAPLVAALAGCGARSELQPGAGTDGGVTAPPCPQWVATHAAVQKGDAMEIRDAGGTDGRAEFMVLHEGRIQFLGSAAELLASKDPYLQRFLYRTLPPW